jgi:hypothetical protein
VYRCIRDLLNWATEGAVMNIYLTPPLNVTPRTADAVRLKATHLRDGPWWLKHLYDDEGFLHRTTPRRAHHAVVRGVRRERRDRADAPGCCASRWTVRRLVESDVLVMADIYAP